jgi:hypothetical protein
MKVLRKILKLESLKAFLHIDTLAEHIFFYGRLIIAGLGAAIGIIYALIYISACCSEIEEEIKNQRVKQELLKKYSLVKRRIS